MNESYVLSRVKAITPDALRSGESKRMSRSEQKAEVKIINIYSYIFKIH